tara:strand:+ start:136 stop:291 length:156 start_codon:yes stop_codon:yes gene_type:complete
MVVIFPRSWRDIMPDIEAQTNGTKKIKIDLDPPEWIIIAITVIIVSYLVYM